jgi:hypothetical protein
MGVLCDGSLFDALLAFVAALAMVFAIGLGLGITVRGAR